MATVEAQKAIKRIKLGEGAQRRALRAILLRLGKIFRKFLGSMSVAKVFVSRKEGDRVYRNQEVRLRLEAEQLKLMKVLDYGALDASSDDPDLHNLYAGTLVEAYRLGAQSVEQSTKNPVTSFLLAIFTVY